MDFRRWIQVHLSTAVVLMCVAGALLGLNLHPYEVPGTQAANYSSDEMEAHEDRSSFSWVFYGWPQYAYGAARLHSSARTIPVEGKVFIEDEGLPLGWDAEALIVNISSWVLIIVGVGFLLELRIRGYQFPAVRLHRLTYAIVAVLACALLWQNFHAADNKGADGFGCAYAYYSRGWPLTAYYDDYSKQGLPEARGLHPAWVLLDAWIGVGLLALTGACCEWRLRRSANRRSSSPATPAGVG